jgi:hypothetical protein
MEWRLLANIALLLAIAAVSMPAEANAVAATIG